MVEDVDSVDYPRGDDYKKKECFRADPGKAIAPPDGLRIRKALMYVKRISNLARMGKNRLRVM